MWSGAVVQFTNGNGTNVNSLQSSAFASAVTTGNTVIVQVNGDINTTPDTVSVTDTEGNTYTCDILNAYNAGSSNVISNPGTNNVPAGVSWTGVWRASNVTGGSSFKFTVTLGGSTTGTFVAGAQEVSGPLTPTSPIDVSSDNAGSSGSPSTGTFTSTYASDFIVLGICGLGGGSAATFTAPSGYTSWATQDTASLTVDGNFAYQVVGTVQTSVNPTWTVTNFTDWVAVAVAYKAQFIVQETTQASGSGVNSVQTSAFGSAVTTGDTVLVFVMGDSFSASATVSVSDTESNSYTCDLLDVYNSGNDVITNPTTTNVPATSTNCFISVWRASNVTGGSSFKTTVTLGGSATGKLYIAAAEFNGLANTSPVDTSTSNATALADPTTGSFSTSNANDLIVIAFCGMGNAVLEPSITTPSGYTAMPLSNTAEGTPCGQACYQIVSATQSSVNPSWTTPHITDNVAIAVAYKAGGASVPAAPTGLSASYGVPSSSNLELSWTNPSGTLTDNHYYVGTTNVFASATKVDLGYVVSSCQPGNMFSPLTIYYFWVTASNSTGESLPDGPASIETTALPGVVFNSSKNNACMRAAMW